MSNHNPLVTIGMPIYNGEGFLRETLDSILAQTFEDFELIISDNASTDRTKDICLEYVAKDRRIRYYRNEENLGAARNYNRTFELSTGKYFKWAACDDICAPEYLKHCVEVLERMPSVVLCYPRQILVNEKGEHMKAQSLFNIVGLPRPHQRFKYYHDLWHRNGYISANAIFGLIRSSALKKTLLIGSYMYGEVALLTELALLGEFYEVPEYLFFFRFHPQTSRATRESSGFEGLALWFDPSNKGKIVLSNWALFFQQIISVNRMEMSWYEKVFCYAQVGKWFSWKWRRLATELTMATMEVFVRGSSWKSKKNLPLSSKK